MGKMYGYLWNFWSPHKMSGPGLTCRKGAQICLDRGWGGTPESHRLWPFLALFPGCGRWGEPSRSRVEAAPNVQWSRAIEIRLYPPFVPDSLQFSFTVHYYLFSYPPTPTPVDLYLCSVMLSTVIKSLSDRYTNRGRDPALPSGSSSTSDRASARPSPTNHSSVTHPLCSILVVTLDDSDLT